MSQFNTATLTDLTNRTVSAGVIQAADHEAWRNDVESRIADLNDAAQALASLQSGASAPSNNAIQGQIWFDTANALWKGDPDGAGADDTFLTKLKAYTIDLATGGTATFRLGGRLGTDTTQTARAGNASTSFISKTIPGGTLGVDGQYLYAFFGGTKTGTAGTPALEVTFGGSSVGAHNFGTTTAFTWIVEAWIFRVNATQQKAFSILHLSGDASGSTSLVVYTAVLNKTLASNQTLALGITNVGAAGDTVTQEAMMWEYHG